MFFFFFSSRRRHTRCSRDWSSDVCSSDLLLLVLITFAPLLSAAVLGILGKPLRHWIAHAVGKHSILQGWWSIFFPVAAMVLAMLSLTVIYRVARPKEGSLRNVLPGAAVATLLWWVADVGFGAYVRRVPYSVVYGGLAAVIGLIIWMELSAVIIFLGAAWNAESAEIRKFELSQDRKSTRLNSSHGYISYAVFCL